MRNRHDFDDARFYREDEERIKTITDILIAACSIGTAITACAVVFSAVYLVGATL